MNYPFVLSCILFSFASLQGSQISNGRETFAPEISNSEESSSSEPPRGALKRKLNELTSSVSESSLARLSRSVQFVPEVLRKDNFVFDTYEDAEFAYWKALSTGKFELACRMFKEGGVRLLKSNFTFTQLNHVIQHSGTLTKDLISHIFNCQPQLFCSNFENGRNIFENTSQLSVSIVLTHFKQAYNTHINIFKEYLRNPSLFLHDDFFRLARAKQARKMIEIVDSIPDIAEAIMEKVYLLPDSLICYDLEGETIFTKAIRDKNTKRIEWLMKRGDAFELIQATNNSGEDVIDLASSPEYSKLDPNHEVLCDLVIVLSSAYSNGHSFEEISGLINRIIKAAKEVPVNVVLITSLLEELDTCQELAERDNSLDGSHENIISLFIESALIVDQISIN
jgi:hypothetical protein